jgi:hypothetical protein
MSNRTNTDYLSSFLPASLQKRAPKPKRKNVARFSLKRCPVQIRGSGLNASLIHGQFFSTDVGSTAMRVTCEFPLENDELVSISVDDSQRSFIQGRVVWCKTQLPTPRIIGKSQFQYRAEIRFQFDNPVEAAGVRDFFATISKSPRTL